MNTSLLTRLILRFGLHLLFWAGVFLFFVYFFGYGSNNADYGFSFALFLMPITIAVTYISIYNLIPNYLLQKRYFKFGQYALYTLVISSYLIAISIFYGIIYLSKAKYSNMTIASKNIVFIMVGVYLVVFIVSAFKLMKLNVKAVENTSALQQKILDTQLKLKEQELNYLKMQIQPHFLFNTLNTMYGFSLKKADETPEMILKLSNLLDYLLYEVDKPLVPLSEEIHHLEDYINLEQMRFSDRLNITFNDDDCNTNLAIAPMLLLPFIENSFKHGSIIEGKLHVDIIISTIDNIINFGVINTSIHNENTKNGIGLQNVKKRLELLYPEQHELDITQTDSQFKVHLKLTTTPVND